MLSYNSQAPFHVHLGVSPKTPRFSEASKQGRKSHTLPKMEALPTSCKAQTFSVAAHYFHRRMPSHVIRTMKASALGSWLQSTTNICFVPFFSPPRCQGGRQTKHHNIKTSLTRLPRVKQIIFTKNSTVAYPACSCFRTHIIWNT